MTRVLRVLHFWSVGLLAGEVLCLNFLAALGNFHYFESLPEEPTPGLGEVSHDVAMRMFGDLMGGIFPIHFALEAGLTTVALLTALWLGWLSRADWAPLRTLLILLAAAIAWAHLVWLYPTIEQIGVERYAAFDAGELDRAAELKSQFFVWHGISLMLDWLVGGLLVIALGMLARPPAVAAAPPLER